MILFDVIRSRIEIQFLGFDDFAVIKSLFS